ncbi:hypothetical protein C8J56DRAFT_883952 [Mycena floridula]|nr:hypothetical protein C8J56DRAFT_883952 [Mycena floridula]
MKPDVKNTAAAAAGRISTASSTTMQGTTMSQTTSYTSEPSTHTTSTSPYYQEWVQQNGAVISAMLNNCKSFRALSLMTDGDDADLWDSIVTQYGRPTALCRMEAEKKYQNCTLVSAFRLKLLSLLIPTPYSTKPLTSASDLNPEKNGTFSPSLLSSKRLEESLVRLPPLLLLLPQLGITLVITDPYVVIADDKIIVWTNADILEALIELMLQHGSLKENLRELTGLGELCTTCKCSCWGYCYGSIVQEGNG